MDSATTTTTSSEAVPMPRLLMNIEEAADYLRVSVRQIHRLRDARSIKAVRIGRRLIFKRAELDRYVELQMALAA